MLNSLDKLVFNLFPVCQTLLISWNPERTKPRWLEPVQKLVLHKSQNYLVNIADV